MCSRVSIVDDDASVRRALDRLCRSAEYLVDTYESAEDFLEFTAENPSCLILDVHLPGRSGLQLQDQLIAEHREFPIIFMTAYDDIQVRDKALEAGAVAFLIKPLDSERLLGAIKDALK